MELPAAFEQRMRSNLGEDYDSFLGALGEPPVTSIRLNPLKPMAVSTNRTVPWCTNGYFLNERPVFTLDPLFHAGCYYVQEAGSMFLDHVLRELSLPRESTAIDLCAAPGGKTTILGSYFQGGMVIANEVIRSRAHILQENCTKWGTGNFVVTNNDPRAFGQLEGFADLLLIDAPCSGEGLFRKDPRSKDEWSTDNCKLCVERQQRIVGDSIECLKEGGILIYSTCTYNEEENDGNVERFIREHDLEPVSVQVPDAWKISTTKFGFQFIPHLTEGEGFYLSVLRKNQGRPGHKSRSKKANNTKLKPANNDQFNDVFTFKPAHEVLVNETNYKTLVNNYINSNILPLSNLNTWSIGTGIGAVKGKKFVPDHAAAMCTQIKFHNLQYLELDLQNSLLFLKKETIPSTTLNDGFCIVQFKGHNLGFIKKIGHRSNNYYPKEWRIRMDINSRLK